VTPLDRAELRRWKHTLDYHRDKYGKGNAMESEKVEEVW
jgi:hypothetical protein